MIDKNKQYCTRDGREVRIYATDGNGGFPVHGAVLENGEWRLDRWSSSGDWAPQDMAACVHDLIEVKPRIRREVWVNVYPDSVGSVFKTREEADKMRPCTHNRIACVKLTIDCEEGEGL